MEGFSSRLSFYPAIFPDFRTNMKSHLLERFPLVSWSLLTTPQRNPYELFQDEKGRWNAKRLREGCIESIYGDESADEINLWRSSLQLEGVDLILIYGLGLGDYFYPLQEWLEEAPDRKIVFIEKDLAVVDAYLKMYSEDIFKHPRVHLQLMEGDWRQLVDAICEEFPSSNLILTALHAYSKSEAETIHEMRVHAGRRALLWDSMATDAFNAPFLFQNVYANAQKIPSSCFVNRWRERFKGIPAIICGAGPSLDDCIDQLKKMGDRALIMAGGSTITALSAHELIPHIGVALDPNLLEYERLKHAHAFEMPFVFASRLYPKVFSLFNGPLGYLYSDLGGEAEAGLASLWKLSEPIIGHNLSSEALSVTTLSLALASAMGCSPIILVGVDLAFTHNASYAAGVVAENAPIVGIDCLDRTGQPVKTLTKWIMEADVINRFAVENPESHVINSTAGGLGFPDIAYLPLEEVAEHYCTRTYDLENLLRTESEHARFPQEMESVVSHSFQMLYESLKRMEVLLENPPDSLGKEILLEMDLQDELAFNCLFKNAYAAMQRMGATNDKLTWTKQQVQNYLNMF